MLIRQIVNRPLNRWAVFVLLAPAAWVIGGCGAKYMATPFTAPDPVIISADQREISIKTAGWTLPDKQARRHCEKYGKMSRYVSAIRYNGEYDDHKLHFYNCI